MSVRIGLAGSGLPFADPAAFWRWVDLCEASEIDSVWLSDRLVSSQLTLEPMSALAAVAGRTSRLKFGMNAIVLPTRDPLVLAKECATVDYLSDGRLLPAFGVGGDAAPEWQATGRGPTGRGAQSDEMLQIMTRLWSEDHVSFQGKYYKYEDVTIAPKPVQSPLPVWIGGNSPAAVRRTARYGTGWLGGAAQTPAQVATVVTAIKAALAESSRSIDDDHYGASFSFRFGSWEEPAVERAAQALSARLGGVDPRPSMAVGDAEAIVAMAQAYHDAGISKFVLRPIVTGEAELLEQCRRLNVEVLPRVHAIG